MARKENQEVSFKTLYNRWLAERSLPVGISIVTAIGAIKYAAITGTANSLADRFLSSNIQLHSRNFALFGGIDSGISFFLKRLTGEENIYTSMFAGFGAAAISNALLRRGRGAISMCVFFSLCKGGLYKLGNQEESFKALYNQWLAERSLPVGVSVVTATGAIKYAAITETANILARRVLSSDIQLHSRKIALFGGVDSGITYLLKRLTGEENIYTSMFAGFGVGAILARASLGRGGGAISVGVFFALCKGGLFKLESHIFGPPSLPMINDTNSDKQEIYTDVNDILPSVYGKKKGKDKE